MTFLKPVMIACSANRSRTTPRISGVSPIVPGSVALALFGVYGSTGIAMALPSLSAIALTVSRRHERVAAVHVLRSALLGAARVERARRLAGGHRRLHLRPRHHLELDERLALDGCCSPRRAQEMIRTRMLPTILRRRTWISVRVRKPSAASDALQSPRGVRGVAEAAGIWEERYCVRRLAELPTLRVDGRLR